MKTYMVQRKLWECLIDRAHPYVKRGEALFSTNEISLILG